MTEPIDLELLSQTFKDVFSTKAGQIVLNKIKQFCLANPNQNMACVESTNQTFYNLGAYSVYRYIQFQMDLQPGQTNSDCVIENEIGE
jgi:hypothetical protein